MSTLHNIDADGENSQEHSPKPSVDDNVFHDQRLNALNAARQFESNDLWVQLARTLFQIRLRHPYRSWGFKSFARYVQDELDLSKSTVAEVLRAYQYVKDHHPECLVEKSSAAEHIPPYSKIIVLARQRQHMPEAAAEVLDHTLFTTGIPRAVLRQEIKRAVVTQRDVQPVAAAQDDSPPVVQESQEHQALFETLQAFFDAVDFQVLHEQLTHVFDSWEEPAIADRRQLYGKLLCLIDQLEAIRATIQHAGSKEEHQT